MPHCHSVKRVRSAVLSIGTAVLLSAIPPSTASTVDTDGQSAPSQRSLCAAHAQSVFAQRRSSNWMPKFCVFILSQNSSERAHQKSNTGFVYVVVRIDTGFGWMNGNYIGFSPSCFVSARHNGAATSCTSVRQRRVADDAPSFCLCLLVRTIYGRNRRVRILRIVGTHAND